MFDELSDALSEFKKGNPIIVTDDELRENEGDIIFPACYSTQEKLNFCAQFGRGLVCIAIDQATANRLELKPLRSNQSDKFHTAFFDPIDAAHMHGTTTGISAAERSNTALLVSDKNSKPSDFIKPGHLFPVVAKEKGLLEREGHTEAAVDLCKMSGLSPAAIICEIMDDAGNMLRGQAIFDFAKKHKTKIVSVQQLIEKRKEEKNIIQYADSILPTQHGTFKIKVFKNLDDQTEHVCLIMDSKPDQKPLVRLHSECLTGDIFGSYRCDCGNQLQSALEAISKRGHGMLVYIRSHEGRGIGIGNKIAAYALQDHGEDTYNANKRLGFQADQRDYSDAIGILKMENYTDIDLITNNPEKINSLIQAGILVEQYSIPSKLNAFNEKYLQDKKNIGNHQIKMI